MTPNPSIERLSSGYAVFLRRVFPWLLLGVFVLVGAGLGTVLAANHIRVPMVVLLLPLPFVALGLLLSRIVLRKLADRVDRSGDTLVVEKDGRQARIALDDVREVTMTRFSKPPRVILQLRAPSPLGERIEFVPRIALGFNPFAEHPVVVDLRARIASARQVSG